MSPKTGENQNHHLKFTKLIKPLTYYALSQTLLPLDGCRKLGGNVIDGMVYMKQIDDINL